MQNLILASTLLLASAAPAATSPPRDCIECSMEKGRVSLCPPHRNEEASVLREAKKGFASESTLERRDALKAAAKLTDAHANAPSPKVAGLLCEGLTDESLKVRECALEHLLEGQHPETTVRGLLEATDDMLERWEKLQRELQSILEKQASGKAADTISKQKGRDFMNVPATCAQLLAALGRIPDERCEARLVKVLEEDLDDLPGRFFVAAAGACIDLGSRDGIEAVTRLLVRLGEALEKGKVDHFYAKPSRMTLAVAWAMPTREATSVDLAQVAEALGEEARSRGLDPGPGALSVDAPGWEEWFAENGQAFEEELGRCTAPVESELPEPLSEKPLVVDDED